MSADPRHDPVVHPPGDPSVVRQERHDRRGGDLPAESTSFVGRRQEVGEVERLVKGSRLVTLVGVGGVGKTRLARRVAAQLQPELPDGVRFVDLTMVYDAERVAYPVNDPEILAHLIAATLGLRGQSVRPPVQLLTAYFARRRFLLVLDNCDYFVPACMVVTNELLGCCPRLRILATSREPLGTYGETLFLVPPLSTPDRTRPRRQVNRCESVALFVARARQAVPSFRLVEADQEVVAEICQRLDGLPLAIELAAARLATLGPRQLLDGLADRFDLLGPGGHGGHGGHGGPDRQRTLRACIDWSFELCAKPERTLWGRLAAFAGGFELDAVEGVCADDDLPRADILDLVATLLDKSILFRDDHGEQARYRMLETIRDYGHDKLVEAGQEATLRARHRDWYEHLVAAAHEAWISDQQAYWLGRLGREHPNLRVAVEYCLTEPGQAEAALRMTVRLPVLYWRLRGLFSEGRCWLDRALAQTSGATLLRARALLLASHLAVLQGDVDAGMRLLEQGQDVAQRLDAATELAFACLISGVGTLYRNEVPVAVEVLERGLSILSQAPEPDLELRLDLLNVLGVAAGLAGLRERAVACQQEMVSITEPRGEIFYRSRAMWARAVAAWREGSLPEAVEQARESLRLKQAQGSDDRYGIALVLETLAWIAADEQRHRRVTILLGAADTLWTELGTPIASLQHFAPYHDGCERQATDALGDAAAQRGRRLGRNLTLQDALAFALEQR